MTWKDAELQADTQRPRQRHPSSGSKRPGGGGWGGNWEGVGGRREEGASCPRDKYLVWPSSS